MLGIIFATLLVSAPAEARRGHHVRPVRVQQHHPRHHRHLHRRAIVRPSIPHIAPHGLIWTWIPGYYNHRHVWITGHWDLRIRL